MESLDCVRPNCDKKVDVMKSNATVSLAIWRQGFPTDPNIRVHQRELCPGCSSDLADWWLHGKKS